MTAGAVFAKAACALVLAAAMSCGTPYRPAAESEIDLLASDVHVRVGGARLTLPVIALPSYLGGFPFFSSPDTSSGERREERDRLDAFVRQANGTATAPSLDRLQVSIHAYGWNDSGGSLGRICGRLTRRWAQSVCDDPWAPLRQALPENGFDLVDLRKPEIFDNHSTVGGENKGNQFHAMRLRQGRVSTRCDRVVRSDTRFCTAALPITGHLGAVWTVWDESGKGGESPGRKADREGGAILAFVTHAIGPAEDHSKLLTTACAARRPGSKLGPGSIDPCPDRMTKAKMGH